MTTTGQRRNDFRRLRRGTVFDPQVFDDELRYVFGESWLFVAHESEIPETGDYVVRKMGDDEVIVCRSKAATSG